MSNHFHLLLEVHRFPTARILQSLLTGYARRFFSAASILPDLESCQSPLFDDNPVLAWAMLQFDMDWMENSIQS
jgi:hypothetical protein